MDIDSEKFRQYAHDWLVANCPESMRQAASIDAIFKGGRNPVFEHPDAKLWLDRMAGMGWTVPDWPKAYGGGGLSAEQTKILKQEMTRLHCRPPLTGHGIWMLGPALLEFGSEEQKQQHLPKIARGEIRWCQGYSEPEAGSDLASVRCKAEDKGDFFLVNGSKTWTTDADKADWIFCLVRTDPNAKKQEGISFLLIDMNDPGIITKPITLISGESDFCDTFFDQVKVPKNNLVGKINQGWTIAKRLLLYERAMMSDLQAFIPKPKYSFQKIALLCLEAATNPAEKTILRDKTASIAMDYQALKITSQRIFEEAKAGSPSPAAFILKYYGTETDKRRDELVMDLLGNSGNGWQGEMFESYQLAATRQYLQSKGLSLGGGSSEIQLNIIAKNVLELPD